MSNVQFCEKYEFILVLVPHFHALLLFIMKKYGSKHRSINVPDFRCHDTFILFHLLISSSSLPLSALSVAPMGINKVI